MCAEIAVFVLNLSA